MFSKDQVLHLPPHLLLLRLGVRCGKRGQVEAVSTCMRGLTAACNKFARSSNTCGLAGRGVDGQAQRCGCSKPRQAQRHRSLDGRLASERPGASHSLVERRELYGGAAPARRHRLRWPDEARTCSPRHSLSSCV